MGTRRSYGPGPTAQRVRVNLTELRVRRGVSLRALSKRLEVLGHPLLPSGLSKIETGARRADVDDLTALAIALDVSPNRLLLPGTAGDDKAELTPEADAKELNAWRWATGEVALPTDLWADKHAGTIDADRANRFRRENRPHDPSGQMLVKDAVKHQEVLAPAISACMDAIRKSGLPQEDVLYYIGVTLKTQEWFGSIVEEAKKRSESEGGQNGEHR